MLILNVYEKLLKYDIINSFLSNLKSQFAQEIKKLLPERCPETVPVSNINEMFVFKYMGHCHKVPIKTLKMIKTYEDLFNHLWVMFKYVSNDSSRTDIMFDNYFEQSVKQHERHRRSSDQKIEVKIANVANACQKLPIEMENFWSSSNNKIQLQQMFIDRFISTSNYHIPVYLGKWFAII